MTPDNIVRYKVSSLTVTSTLFDRMFSISENVELFLFGVFCSIHETLIFFTKIGKEVNERCFWNLSLNCSMFLQCNN